MIVGPILFYILFYTKLRTVTLIEGPLIIKLVGISSLLLTVLGFVVGLSLSFRSSTAYERYKNAHLALPYSDPTNR